jgi:NAD(P)-dependent dehydrogenase (short-subunit alcohol dehydrogenase family)
MEITGSTVVVTGGQRGLGRALVEAFLAAGAVKVYATARTPRISEDARIVPVPLEVSDASSVAQLAVTATDATIIVNNAGIPLRTPLLTVEIDKVREVFDTNVFGPLRVTQAFAPVLAHNGGGAVVNISSVMAWTAGAAAYGATKAAVSSLTNSLRVELAGQHTEVLGVHLSYTDTDMTATLALQKNSAAGAAATIVAAVAAGVTEVLVDDDSRRAKKLLSGPPEGLQYSFSHGRLVFDGEQSAPVQASA